MKVVICGGRYRRPRPLPMSGRPRWYVVVLQKDPGPRAQGYMIDFFGPGYDAAEAMGILSRLKELAYPVSEIASIGHTGRTRAA